MIRLHSGAFAIALASAVVVPRSALTDSPLEDEIRLAESAGPPHIAAAATIYARGTRGYEVVRRGTNGFACLVEQSHPLSVEPVCYDREGVDAHVPVTLARASWRAAGLDSTEIARRIAAGYEKGTFRAPRSTGVAYMLSPETRFWNSATGAVEPGSPHLMFYAPYLTNADIGSRGEMHADIGVPFVIEEGGPRAYVVVLLRNAERAASTRSPG